MKQMFPLISLAAASIVAMAGGAALAHSDTPADVQKAANGGQLRMAGSYHYELVVAPEGKAAQDSPVLVFVTDHAGTKISTVGAAGTATILAGKTKAVATLLPAGDNRMQGTAKYASTPDMKVVVSITLPAKATEQVRFTPLAVAKDTHTDHHH